MTYSIRRLLFIALALVASGFAALTTGCASGGFKLTRQYAGWVNSQTLILRVVLYVLTLVVFGVTLIVDAVVFNTMDFWEGRVSQGTFNFEKDGHHYVVEHRLRDGLRVSRIEIRKSGRLIKQVSIEETSTGEIEYFENGALKAQVDRISLAPRITYLTDRGEVASQETIALSEQFPFHLAFQMPRKNPQLMAGR